MCLRNLLFFCFGKVFVWPVNFKGQVFVMASDSAKSLEGLKKALFRACENQDTEFSAGYWALLRSEVSEIKKKKEKERLKRILIGK